MMAKLYWRVKMNGKWTWQSATDLPTDPDKPFVKVLKRTYDSRYMESREDEEE